MTTTIMTSTTMPSVTLSRKPLFTFLGLVTVLVALSYAVAFSGGEGNAQGGLVLVQFAPALSAIITKLIYQRNLQQRFQTIYIAITPPPSPAPASAPLETRCRPGQGSVHP